MNINRSSAFISGNLSAVASAKADRRFHAAFTLVELMVVVGIIALLVAIVLPAVNAARVQAKSTATANTIRVIDIGAEQFRADLQLGGEYPPSDRLFGAIAAASPHDNTPIVVNGASLIVWALAGADLLGTPGFRNVNGNDATLPLFQGIAPWYDDMGNTTGGLYQLNAAGQPANARSGPFVDVSKMSFPTRTGTSFFQIPSAKIPLGGNATRTGLSSLCFLDNFDQPILYYKAHPAKSQIASMALGNFNNGIYNPYDNVDITGGLYLNQATYQPRYNNPASATNGMDFGAGHVHPLGLVFPEQYGISTGSLPAANGVLLLRSARGSFTYTVWNPNLQAITGGSLFPKPHRSDSFILISAGPDGLFGTADDIANFDIYKGKE